MSLFFILIVSARLREIPNPQLFVTQNVHSLSLMQRRETVGEKLSRHWYGWIDPAGRAATSGLEWHMHRTADTRTVNKNTIRIIKLCVAAGLMRKMCPKWPQVTYIHCTWSCQSMPVNTTVSHKSRWLHEITPPNIRLPLSNIFCQNNGPLTPKAEPAT